MKQQNGNALFIILIAIALFGGLTYAMSQSNSGSADIDDERLTLNAAEIAQIASTIESTVKELMAVNGCTDTQISFAYDSDGDGDVDASDNYWNNSAPANGMCNVFGENGGKLAFPALDASLFDPAKSALYQFGKIFITSTSCVADVGTGPSNTCNSSGPDDEELTLYLPNITKELCTELARGTSGFQSSGELMEDAAHAWDEVLFDGNYADGKVLYLGSRTPKTGCYRGLGYSHYNFYHVLLAR